MAERSHIFKKLWEPAPKVIHHSLFNYGWAVGRYNRKYTSVTACGLRNTVDDFDYDYWTNLDFHKLSNEEIDKIVIEKKFVHVDKREYKNVTCQECLVRIDQLLEKGVIRPYKSKYENFTLNFRFTGKYSGDKRIKTFTEILGHPLIPAVFVPKWSFTELKFMIEERSRDPYDYDDPDGDDWL